MPVKVDPKTFFANERTLLLWLHSALWLFAGASTIIKYSNEDPLAELYGVMLLPIALAFTTYALFQREYIYMPEWLSVHVILSAYMHRCQLSRITLLRPNPSEIMLSADVRRVKMIRVKHPGPYEDLLGPALLGIALMTAIVAQFTLKLYSVWYY